MLLVILRALFMPLMHTKSADNFVGQYVKTQYAVAYLEISYYYILVPGPTHFVKYGLVAYIRFLGPLPYCLVSHFPWCSLLNHSLPESRHLIGQKGKWYRAQNSFSTKSVGSENKTTITTVEFMAAQNVTRSAKTEHNSTIQIFYKALKHIG